MLIVCVCVCVCVCARLYIQCCARFTSAGVNSFNPGAVLSELYRTYVDPAVSQPILRPFLWAADTAALTPLYLATSAEPCGSPGT